MAYVLFFIVAQEYPDVPRGDYGIKPEELSAMSREHDSLALQKFGGVSILVYSLLFCLLVIQEYPDVPHSDYGVKLETLLLCQRNMICRFYNNWVGYIF